MADSRGRLGGGSDSSGRDIGFGWSCLMTPEFSQPPQARVKRERRLTRDRPARDDVLATDAISPGAMPAWRRTGAPPPRARSLCRLCTPRRLRHARARADAKDLEG